MLAPGAPVLHAFARSRLRPVRRTVKPLSRLRLTFDEWLGWRLRGGDAPDAAMVQSINLAWARLRDMSDSDLDQELARPPVAAARLLRDGAPDFAAVIEGLRRHTGLALRPNQIDCALALLSGACVELRTGEGKTLAAALAALVAARVGVSTHVVTVNDYLAQRDHALIRPVAQRLGLRSAVLLQHMPEADRRAAYDSDIVYGTNKSFVFDHLRDRREARTTPGSTPRQMGQALAICDEADSVLIDDATVPMILSELGKELAEAELTLFRQLDAFAQTLAAPRDRRRDGRGAWRLTESGIAALALAARDWTHPIARSDDLLALAEQALAARHQFREGEAYVLQDGAVVMVDQATGRLMPDRRWDFGLQQLVEIAAGVPPSPESRTVGQITQQTYFRQYRILSGLTGTARECRAEFWAIYGLPLRRIRAHAPLRLADLGLRVFRDAEAKWQHIARRAISVAQTRAVLIGVNDVTEAAALAARFAALDRPVAVLDALSEAQEAALVARAGQSGSITIATHLAGRGTDIVLSPSVRDAGGLHVIIGSAMASGRLERQLCGRAGRAGDPGSHERAISLQDRMLHEGAQSPWRRAAILCLRLPLAPLQAAALALVQSRRDRRARALRRSTLLREQDILRQLGYTQ